MDKNIFYKEASAAICGTLDIQTALERLYVHLKRSMPVDLVGLYLLDHGLNAYRTIARVYKDQRLDPGKIISLPRGSNAFWADFWGKMDQATIVNRPDSLPEMLSFLSEHQFDTRASFIHMKMEIGDHRTAIFFLSATGHDRYKNDHARRICEIRGPISMAMANAIKHQELARLKEILDDDNQFLRDQLMAVSHSEIIGANSGLIRVMGLARQVAAMDTSVLLLGETGVGKGVIARAIHNASPRKDGPFIHVNCGAIPDTLLDSELFGHEKGAFSGAVAQKRGRFERAHGGTIFLDEIGELPPPAQVRLLNVLQTKTIERVGGQETHPVDIRVIAATHRDLQGMIETKEFREDLWFRLNVYPIMIPPLRQRKKDIPALVDYFIQKKSKELKIYTHPRFQARAMEELQAYHWPGNVRELENVVERSLIQQQTDLLSVHGLKERNQASAPPRQTTEDKENFLSFEEMAHSHILRAMELSGGKVNGPGGAAEFLDIHPNTLRRKMDRLGIPFRKRQKE